MKKFYFDTSIWLDFLENRDEPNLPKGTWAKELIKKIIGKRDFILYSDLTLAELNKVGYSSYDINCIFSSFKKNLVFVEVKKEEFGKGRDLSLKRNIPKGDAIHALIARNNSAIFVTLDKHFKKLNDIVKSFGPRELL